MFVTHRSRPGLPVSHRHSQGSSHTAYNIRSNFPRAAFLTNLIGVAPLLFLKHFPLPGSAGEFHLTLRVKLDSIGTGNIVLSSPAVNPVAHESAVAALCRDDVPVVQVHCSVRGVRAALAR